MLTAAEIDILVTASTSAAVVRGLYQLRKAKNAKFSLGYLCRAIGIPSTGYLSDVMSGKRIIHAKYRDAAILVFGLADETAELFSLLCAQDDADASDEALARRLETLRKAVRIAYRPTPAGGREFRFALELFCAFSLFRNTPTTAQLEGYFGAARAPDVAAALAHLEAIQLIGRDGEQWRVLSTHIIFGPQENGLSHIDYLRTVLHGAADDVAQWFDRKGEAYFTSMIFSVERQRFAEHLKEFRRKVIMTQADLESTDADMLISFNVQVYPLGTG